MKEPKPFEKGDHLFRLIYFGNPPRAQKRSVSKRKIKSVSGRYARFIDGSLVPLLQINDDYIDEWYTSRELMYSGKLQAFLKEYAGVLFEIEHLKKKVNKAPHKEITTSKRR